MRLQRVLGLGLLGAALSGAVQAAERDPMAGVEPLLDPRLLFGGVVTETDVNLVFAQLRAALQAAAAGREPPPVPEALSRRMDTVAAQLQQRGIIAGLLLSEVLERAVRDQVREFNGPGLRSHD